MSVVITREDIIAYAEVDYIIHHMNDIYIKKIPEKILSFFSTIKDPEHKIYIDPYVPLQKQNLRKYTLEIIALLHLKYWCEDEYRRKMLYEKMIENQKKLDEQMREKYNLDNMFGLNSITDVGLESDYEEIDYSKPKNVTKYDAVVENNSDIEDYTDVQEDKLSNYLNVDKNKIEKLKSDEKAIIAKTNFIVNLINKIKNIFIKK